MTRLHLLVTRRFESWRIFTNAVKDDNNVDWSIRW